MDRRVPEWTLTVKALRDEHDSSNCCCRGAGLLSETGRLIEDGALQSSMHVHVTQQKDECQTKLLRR